MATHSSILAWEITWTEETGRLQSMVFRRVGHDLETQQQSIMDLNTHTHTHTQDNRAHDVTETSLFGVLQTFIC